MSYCCQIRIVNNFFRRVLPQKKGRTTIVIPLIQMDTAKLSEFLKLIDSLFDKQCLPF